MKKIKAGVVLMVILFGHSALMQAMFTRNQAVWRTAATRAPRVQAQAQSGFFNKIWSYFSTPRVSSMPRVDVIPQQRMGSLTSSSRFRPSGVFARGGRRFYSTAIQAPLPVPASFPRSWGSLVPGDTNRIENIFDGMYKRLSPRQVNSIYHEAELPLISSVDELEELIRKTSYNPLNRIIAGEPSFLAKMLKVFWHTVYFSRGQIWWYHGTVGRFYKLGARWRPEEETELFFKKSESIELINQTIKKIDEFTFENNFANLLRYADEVSRWKNFFESIGLNINNIIPEVSKIQWDYMEALVKNCQDLADSKMTNTPIIQLLREQPQNIFKSHREPGGVIADANTIEELFNIAQKAGFFRKLNRNDIVPKNIREVKRL